jgi:hypothetical protein
VLVVLRGAAQWLLNAYFVTLFFVVLIVPMWDELPSRSGAIASLVVAVIFFAVWGWFKLSGIRRSLGTGAVSSCEGAMSVIQQEVQMMRGYAVRNILLAGGEGYEVPFAVYRVFEDGAQYRAFYTVERPVVVAIEASDRFGESGRLRHRHRWGRIDAHLWWLLLLAGSSAVTGAGLFVGSLALALLGLGNVLLSGLVASAFIRGS